MMRYLNKENFRMSYMDVGKQSKKWENDLLNGESSTTSLLKGVSTHSSIGKVDEDTSNNWSDQVQGKPWFQKVFWLMIYKISERRWTF